MASLQALSSCAICAARAAGRGDPHAGGGRTCIIACSREAKARGIKNIMSVADARAICRDIVLVPQNRTLPASPQCIGGRIQFGHSGRSGETIDELSCWLDEAARMAPVIWLTGSKPSFAITSAPR
jgi:hypothetical protein